MKRGCLAVSSHCLTVLSKSTVVMPECVAATISTMPFSPMAATAFMSPARTDLNGSLVFHSGCWFDLRLHLVDGKRELVVDRLLDPQRAVIVEGGDALGRRHIVGSSLFRHPRDEVDDRLLDRRRRSTTAAGSSAARTCDRNAKRNHSKRLARRVIQYIIMTGDSQCLGNIKRAPGNGRPLCSRAQSPGFPLVIAASTCSFTAWRLNDAPFCIGGNSMAVSASSPTFFWT